MSLLSLTSSVRGLDAAAGIRVPRGVAVHQPDPARAEQAGYRVMAHRAGPARIRPCPSRRARAASRTAPGTSSRSSAEPCPAGTGTGRCRRWCPRCRRTPCSRACPGAAAVVPSQRPALSGRLFPMVTAPGHPPSWYSRQVEPRTSSAVLPGGPGRARPPVPGRRRRRRRRRPRPRHQRQVPGQRRDHVLDRESGISVIKTITRNHERPGQQPLPFPLHQPGAQRARPAIPATPGPALSSSGPSVA